MIDAADLGSAAHRVRLFWTNFIKPEQLQEALPTGIKPRPSLREILNDNHFPSQVGHEDRFPFAKQNRLGIERKCMPTLVSFLRSNAFRTKITGGSGEGEAFNKTTGVWEEPEVEEKEELMGYVRGATATMNITENQRSIRIGRALDGTTMRWLGAFMAAKQK